MIENWDGYRHGWRLSLPEEGTVISQSIRTVALTAFLLSIPSHVATAQNQRPSRGPENGAAAARTVVRGDRFVIFPVETPLQRLLINPAAVCLLVSIDGRGCYPDGEFDAKSLDGLRREFGRALRQGDIVQFNIFVGTGQARLETPQLEAMLRTLAADLGLPKNRVSISWTHDVVTWERKTHGLDEGLRPADRRDESGIGDDNVMIYPVRTELSRYLTGADLYVDLRASAARDEERGKAAVETIRRNVPGLEIEHKGTINFRLHLPAGANGVDDLPIQRELQTFAKALGFEKSSLTIGG